MYLQLIKYLTIFFCCAQITNHILALKLSNIQLIAQSIFLAISVLITAFIFPGQFCFFLYSYLYVSHIIKQEQCLLL